MPEPMSLSGVPMRARVAPTAGAVPSLSGVPMRQRAPSAPPDPGTVSRAIGELANVLASSNNKLIESNSRLIESNNRLADAIANALTSRSMVTPPSNTD